MRTIDVQSGPALRSPSVWCGHTARTQSGLTYLALLFAIAMLGATLAATSTIYSQAARRAKEAQLIWIGNEFREAVAIR